MVDFLPKRIPEALYVEVVAMVPSVLYAYIVYPPSGRVSRVIASYPFIMYVILFPSGSVLVVMFPFVS